MGGYSGAGGNVDQLKNTPEQSPRFDKTAELTNAPQYTQFVEPWRPWSEPETANAFDSQQYGREKGYHSERTPSPLPGLGGTDRQSRPGGTASRLRAGTVI